jgi:protein TonB
MNEHIKSAAMVNRHKVGFIAGCLAAVLFANVPALAAAPASTQAPASPRSHAVENRPEAMTVPALLAAALDAHKRGSLIAPASDNTIEYYVATLRKDPHNRVAKDALRELFPYAVTAVEQTIAQGNYDEANREIGLLAKADPTNYSLTLLRAKLGATQSGHAAQHEVTLRATDKCWVAIANANGHVINSRVLSSGESWTYRYAQSLRVTLGNADGVEVSADGKAVAVNATPHAKVAHLELYASG